MLNIESQTKGIEDKKYIVKTKRDKSFINKLDSLTEGLSNNSKIL